MALLALGGCGVDAGVIQARHWDLNETIRQTKNEQLLLNLVRLRYDETPYFLQVSSITTSFSTSTSAGVSGTIPEGGGNVLGVNGGISYSESPTVTWSLPDSREFLGRLHAPLGADQLAVLSQSGFDASLVFRIGVKKMNRLRNLDYDIVEGVRQPDSYEALVEALRLVEELRQDDLVDFAYGVYSNVGGGKVPLSKLDMGAMADGLAFGLQFMNRDDPNVFEPLKLSKPLFLRFSKRSDSDPRAQRLRDLLSLDSAVYSFAIIDNANSGREQLLSESGKLSTIFDPDRKFREIVVNNRSMMEILRFASAYVGVPEADASGGIVMSRSIPPTRRWLQVLNSPGEPANAWLKIKRDGDWFYIAADDLTSRMSFTLLNSLFASVVGDVPGARPLLTLPVK